MGNGTSVESSVEPRVESPRRRSRSGPDLGEMFNQGLSNISTKVQGISSTLNRPPAKRNVRAERLSRLENRQRLDMLDRDIPIDHGGPEPEAESAPARSVSPSRSLHLGFDAPLLLVVSTLVIFGLLMVYSASWQASLYRFDESSVIFIRQIAFTGVGLIAAVILAWMDYHRFQKLILPATILTILMLVGVLIVYDVRHGATRTLLSGSIQPSELAKIVIIIYLSVWLFAKREQLSEISFGLLPLAVILGVFGGLIYLQPDLSATLTIVALGGMLFFLAGGDSRQLVILLVGAMVVGGLIIFINPTGSGRMHSFVAGLKDLTAASTHVQRSIEAFVRGGWFGVGIGKGVTKVTGLPIADRDSIFAVVGEETGLFGAAMLVLAYTLLLWRGIMIARRAPDTLGYLLASGLTLWLVMEAFINMGVMLGLLPFAGNALPFISAGGSNLVVSMAAVGILINVSRMSEKTINIEERTFSAVVDLRRRDWRRGVSRPRRPAGPSQR